MQKKLTKEQAQWLIDEINMFDDSVIRPTRNINDPYATGLSYMRDKIEQIINQCTEKEFPEFLQILPYWGDAELEIKISCNTHVVTGEKQVHIDSKFKDDNDNECICFKFEEFKQFTQGCTEVCKWIQEQECKS